MERKNIFLIGASIVGIFVFLIAAYYATNKPTIAKEFPQLKQIKTTDHVTWSPKKKHILIEYADLQCPACKSFHDSLKQIQQDKTITDTITMVYRHFPLTGPHEFAMDAALSAEAAGTQGKFFTMVDKMYDTQEDWSKQKDAKAIFRTYAEEMKLNMEQYDKDIASEQTKKAIENDMKSGNEVEVDATPTFFLDGKKLEVVTFDEFRNALAEAAQK